MSPSSNNDLFKGSVSRCSNIQIYQGIELQHMNLGVHSSVYTIQRTNKSYLSRTCYSKVVRKHHLCLIDSKAGRRVGKLSRGEKKKKESFGFALIRGYQYGKAIVLIGNIKFNMFFRNRSLLSQILIFCLVLAVNYTKIELCHFLKQQ